MEAPKQDQAIVVRTTITAPDVWMTNLAKQTNSQVVGNTLDFNPDFATGQIKWDQIQNGLYIAKLDFRLKNDLTVIRSQDLNTQFYLIKFQINDASSIEHTIDGEVEELGVSKKYGIVFSNPNTTTMVAYKKDIPVDFFVIFLSKKWITDNILCDYKNGFWYNALTSTESVHIYKAIDQRFISNIDAIYTEGKLIGHIHALNLISSILSEFFLQPEQKVVINKQAAKEVDMAAFLDAKENLEYNWQEAPHMEEICEDTGMTESQFKKAFKRIFGRSPFKHYLNYRMQRAKELLLTGRYTISEVSYMLGYQNLNKFSGAFKKCLGLLPSQYIRLIV